MRTQLFLLACCLSLCAHGQYLVPTLDKTTSKYGYKEKDQVEWSLEPVYEKARHFVGNLAVVSDGEHEFVIDLHGNKVSPNFKSIHSYPGRERLPYVCQGVDGSYNLYDTRFTPICETSYQHLSYLASYGVLAFQTGGLYGIMDVEGNVLVPPAYQELSFQDYYYACGNKRCDKDGITRVMFQGVFLEAQDRNQKYGIVTLGNEVIVPFTYDSSYKLKYKGAKGAYKKTIKPYLLSGKRQEQDARIKEAMARSSARNVELAATYPTDLPAVEKTVVKETTDGYAFFKADRQVSKTYESIDTYDRCCVVSENGKYGIANPLGAETVSCEYDNISIWNAAWGTDILLAEAQGKYGLLDADGTKLPAWDCDMIFLPSNDAGVALKEGKYWLVDKRGNIVSPHGYDDIDNFTTDQKIYAEWLGYKTELSADGKEVSPIVKQVFDEAYALPLSGNAQEKYDKYMLCTALDADNKEGYRALALNNIGALFEDLGDVDKAMGYYGLARDLGNETARKNMKRIKLDRTLDALQQVGNTLSQVAQTIDTSGASSTGLQQGGGGSQTLPAGGSDDVAASGTGAKKRSYDFYKQQYDRWERNAKSICESLSNSSWGIASSSGMKMNLRKAQKEMREVRAKARKDGYDIPQSSWETAKVSY